MDLTHLSAPDTPLAIIGLGYVGLPLAVAFGQHRPVIGFDIKPERIAGLQAGHDSTRETTTSTLATPPSASTISARLPGGVAAG